MLVSTIGSFSVNIFMVTVHTIQCKSCQGFSCHGIFVETLSQASSLHRFIMNQCNDQLLVDLLAQLIELCLSITEVMGSNPMEVFNFFRPYFHYCSSIVYYCKDCFHINFSLACWTPNIHSQSFSVNHADNVFV